MGRKVLTVTTEDSGGEGGILINSIPILQGGLWKSEENPVFKPTLLVCSSPPVSTEYIPLQPHKSRNSVKSVKG
jgi:hypothetical protein